MAKPLKPVSEADAFYKRIAMPRREFLHTKKDKLFTALHQAAKEGVVRPEELVVLGAHFDRHASQGKARQLKKLVARIEARHGSDAGKAFDALFLAARRRKLPLSLPSGLSPRFLAGSAALLGLGLAGVKSFNFLTEKDPVSQGVEEIEEPVERKPFVFSGKLHKNTRNLFAWLPWQEERKFLLSHYSLSPRETVTKVMDATKHPNLRDLFATKRGLDYKLRMLAELHVHYLPWKEQRGFDPVKEVEGQLAKLVALHGASPEVISGGVAWALSNEYELVGSELRAASTTERNEKRRTSLRSRALSALHLALDLRRHYLGAEQADEFQQERSTRALRQALRGLGQTVPEPDLSLLQPPRPSHVLDPVFSPSAPLEQRLKTLTDLHRNAFFKFDPRSFQRGAAKPIEVLPSFGQEDEFQRLEKLLEVHEREHANRYFGKNSFRFFASAYTRLADSFHQAADKIEQRVTLFPGKPENAEQEKQRAERLRLLGEKMLGLASRLENLAPAEGKYSEHH